MNGQIDIFTCLRGFLVKLADHPTTVIDLDFFVAGFTVQGIFVITLNAQLANVVRRRVVRQYAVFIQTLDVAVVDFRHITNHVGEGGTIGIITTLIAYDFNAGEIELVDGKTGDLNFSQGSFDGNRGETARAFTLFLKIINIFRG